MVTEYLHLTPCAQFWQGLVLPAQGGAGAKGSGRRRKWEGKTCCAQERDMPLPRRAFRRAGVKCCGRAVGQEGRFVLLFYTRLWGTGSCGDGGATLLNTSRCFVLSDRGIVKRFAHTQDGRPRSPRWGRRWHLAAVRSKKLHEYSQAVARDLSHR